jgi:hypothetical protein
MAIATSTGMDGIEHIGSADFFWNSRGLARYLSSFISAVRSIYQLIQFIFAPRS